jgi:hypothetical protein
MPAASRSADRCIRMFAGDASGVACSASVDRLSRSMRHWRGRVARSERALAYRLARIENACTRLRVRLANATTGHKAPAICARPNRDAIRAWRSRLTRTVSHRATTMRSAQADQQYSIICHVRRCAPAERMTRTMHLPFDAKDMAMAPTGVVSEMSLIFHHAAIDYANTQFESGSSCNAKRVAPTIPGACERIRRSGDAPCMDARSPVQDLHMHLASRRHPRRT